MEGEPPPLSAWWQLALPAAVVSLMFASEMEAPTMTAEWITAIATAAQAIGVLAALVFAGRQLAEARQQREEQSRPNVIVTLDRTADFQWPELIVENVGQTVATDVRFAIDPPLVSTLFDPPESIGEVGFLKDGIPTLPAHSRLKTVFDYGVERFKQKDALPSRHDVTVTYSSPVGGPYHGFFVLDVALNWNAREVTRHGIHDLVKEVERIRRQLHSWDSMSSLHVATDDDVHRRYEEWQQRIAEDRAEREAKEAAATPPPSPPPDADQD